MNIPHFDQWLGDWAMEPERFMAGYRSLTGLDLHVHLQTGPERAQQLAKEQSQQVTVASGNDGQSLAIVALHGVLMKSVPSGEQGTSTVIARRKIRAAAADPSIAGLALHISSPGGTVDGTEAIAADVAAAAKKKPVYAFIDDLGASAAYWIASQATKIFANGTALVGSIGTYAVVYDLTARAAQQGIKVHVVRAGEMKGQGEPGTEINATLLAELQSRVNARNDFFVRGVAAGRGFSLTKARELADGRVHIAAEALAKGLIDGVQAFDQTMTQLAAATNRRVPKMDATMQAAVASTAQETQTSAAPVTAAQPAAAAAAPIVAQLAQPLAAQPRAATLAELKAACPGANNDFVVAQMEANATADQARTAFVAKLAADNQRLSQENAQLKTAAPAPAAAKAPGADPIPAGSGSATTAAGGDAIAQWDEQLQQLMTDSKLTKAQATRQLCIDQPELQAAYNAAYTKVHGPKVNPRGRA